MDIMMPQMDGYETIRAVRGDAAVARRCRSSRSPPRRCRATARRASPPGASDYITKPVDPDKLLALVGGWLAPWRDDRARAPAGRDRILLVDDHRENLTALRAVLEPLGERLVCAESGEQALRVLLREEISVILLDVRMAGLDGVRDRAR